MKTLKKVVLPLLFVALAATAMILVVFASLKFSNALSDVTVKGITFGAYEQVVKTGGTSVVTELKDYDPSLMPLLGFIFIGVGLIVAAVGLFLLKDEKSAKIVVLVAAVLVLVGGVFQFFALQSFARVTAKVFDQKYEDVLKNFKDNNAKITLCTVGGILGIAASLVLAIRAFLPKK